LGLGGDENKSTVLVISLKLQTYNSLKSGSHGLNKIIYHGDTESTKKYGEKIGLHVTP
jgi:hypothetical protein